MVPPIYIFLAKSPIVEKFDVSSLKESISGAAPLDGELAVKVKERIGFELVRQGMQNIIGGGIIDSTADYVLA